MRKKSKLKKGQAKFDKLKKAYKRYGKKKYDYALIRKIGWIKKDNAHRSLLNIMEDSSVNSIDSEIYVLAAPDLLFGTRKFQGFLFSDLKNHIISSIYDNLFERIGKKIPCVIITKSKKIKGGLREIKMDSHCLGFEKEYEMAMISLRMMMPIIESMVNTEFKDILKENYFFLNEIEGDGDFSEYLYSNKEMLRGVEIGSLFKDIGKKLQPIEAINKKEKNLTKKLWKILKQDIDNSFKNRKDINDKS